MIISASRRTDIPAFYWKWFLNSIHGCAYCYANNDEQKIIYNYENHDEKSELITGHLTDKDIVKERK